MPVGWWGRRREELPKRFSHRANEVRKAAKSSIPNPYYLDYIIRRCVTDINRKYWNFVEQ